MCDHLTRINIEDVLRAFVVLAFTVLSILTSLFHEIFILNGPLSGNNFKTLAIQTSSHKKINYNYCKSLVSFNSETKRFKIGKAHEKCLKYSSKGLVLLTRILYPSSRRPKTSAPHMLWFSKQSYS